MKYICVVLIAISGVFLNSSLCAKEKNLVENYYELPVQDQYHAILNAHHKGEWSRLIEHCRQLIASNPSSPFTSAAKYYLGVGYFYRKKLELADQQFTFYLKEESSPKYFEDAIEYKFKIAEAYSNGARKHIMGVKGLPKIFQ